jgi:co-chaperonin GroES (HSP10)
MDEDKIIDQSALAEDVSNNIKYEFMDHFLVKPLDPIKVTKEFSKPVPTGTPAKDENGIEAQDFDSVETEVKEVDSDYRRGIVLKRPLYYENSKDDFGVAEIKIGDTVLFRETAGLRFDLLKDSRLIRSFDIIGKVNDKH